MFYSFNCIVLGPVFSHDTLVVVLHHHHIALNFAKWIVSVLFRVLLSVKVLGLFPALRKTSGHLSASRALNFFLRSWKQPCRAQRQY